MISGVVAIILLILSLVFVAVILFYVFALKKMPLYKMRNLTFFKVIYDDFN